MAQTETARSVPWLPAPPPRCQKAATPMIGFLNSASPDALAAPFRADFALCVTETGLAGWGPGTQQKRDTKKGPLRQEAGMAPPLPNSAHGDQLISAKPRSTARFLSDRRPEPC
jgi:hypothetical protein